MSTPKPDREEVYGKRDRRDVYPGPGKQEKAQNPDRAKKAKPRVAPKPERRPVDERGVVRRGPGGPAGVVAPKKRGMNRKDLPGPTRKRDDEKRRPPKPRTLEEQKFIRDQMRKNRPIGGAGSAKRKPVMPPRGGK